MGASATPPNEAVVGGWFVTAGGIIGRFHQNPDYRPSSPDSPTDPVDAALHLVVRGEADADVLLSTFREGVFGVGVDERDEPVVTPSPDDVPSLLVTTAPVHRARVKVAGWREVTAEDLVHLLSEDGVDVLFNPGAKASARLMASALRAALDEPAGDVD